MSRLDDTASELRTAAMRFARRLRSEAGHAEYSESQAAVVRHLLEQGAATTSELARIEGMRPQSMSAIVAALEADGVVARRPDPADGRAAQVYLTEESRQALRKSSAAKHDWIVRTMAALSEDEQHTLREAARLMERMLHA